MNTSQTDMSECRMCQKMELFGSARGAAAEAGRDLGSALTLAAKKEQRERLIEAWAANLGFATNQLYRMLHTANADSCIPGFRH